MARATYKQILRIEPHRVRDTVPAESDWMPSVLARHRVIEAGPLPINIDTLLTEAATAAPDTIACQFIATDETVTYARLREEVSRIAAGMCALGIRHRTKVAVMLPNAPAFPLTWLALARIGAVMVPVNVRYTGRELNYAVTDSEATFVILDAAYLSVLEDAALGLPASHVIVVGEPSASFINWDRLRTTPPDPPPTTPAMDDLMNIQYTSGTTGLPKGCMLPQRYWLTCAKAYAACDGLRYRRILSANPFFYMTPQWLLLMAFFQRATLFVAPHLSLSRYADWMRTYQIEFCWFPQDAHIAVSATQVDRDNSMIRANLSLHRKELHAAIEQRFGFPLRTAFGMTEIGMGLYTTCCLQNDRLRLRWHAGAVPRGAHRRSGWQHGAHRPGWRAPVPRPWPVTRLLAKAGRNAGRVPQRLVPQRRPRAPGFARLRHDRWPHQGNDPSRRREHLGNRGRVCAARFAGCHRSRRRARS